MITLPAHAFVLFFLFFGLTGAPAYEFYATINHEAVESIVAEREEAVVAENSSKRPRARRDMHRSSSPSALFGNLSNRNSRFLAVPPSLAWLPDSDIKLHHALQIFRI